MVGPGGSGVQARAGLELPPSAHRIPVPDPQGRKGVLPMTEKVRITHYGHACVLAELPDRTRVLFDPGTYSAGFEDLAGLDAVLVTHEHPDHFDAERLPRLVEANPDA